VSRGKSPKYGQGSGLFSLNQKCIRWNYINTSFGKEIKSDWFRKIDIDFLTQEEDILVNSTGEGTIGRSAIVNEMSKNMIFDSHVLRVRKIICINTRFFISVINSDFGQSKIDDSKGAKSTNQTELGVMKLRNIVVPMPPFIEQNEIVTRLENLMQKCDEAEKAIEDSLNTSNLLTKSILAEAFKGSD
jgi:restriction endonuclease S subunit